MPAYVLNSSGTTQFMAMEDGTGAQVVGSAPVGSSFWARVYDPATGSSCNVQTVEADSGLMLFYGQFGTGVNVILHTVAGGINTDISIPGIGTTPVNCLSVNPGTALQMVTVDNVGQLRSTIDGGANWVDGAVIIAEPANWIKVKWAGIYTAPRLMVALNNGGAERLYYSPNGGASWQDYGATLGDIVAAFDWGEAVE